MQRSLFEDQGHDPLASRLRPDTLEGYVGQTHLLGEGKVLRQLIEQDQILFDDLLGPARRRQNDIGAHHRGKDEGSLCRL